MSSRLPGMCEGRLGIIQPQEEGEEEEGEGFPSPRTTMDHEYSQHSYQDLDWFTNASTRHYTMRWCSRHADTVIVESWDQVLPLPADSFQSLPSGSRLPTCWPDDYQATLTSITSVKKHQGAAQGRHEVYQCYNKTLSTALGDQDNHQRPSRKPTSTVDKQLEKRRTRNAACQTSTVLMYGLDHIIPPSGSCWRAGWCAYE